MEAFLEISMLGGSISLRFLITAYLDFCVGVAFDFSRYESRIMAQPMNT